MEKGDFEVVLQSQLGQKKGIIHFVVDEEVLSGDFEILGHRNKITRIVSTGNNFSFSGELTTAIGTMPYTAAGEIKEGDLIGIMNFDKSTMKITGRRIN